jgi:hypothetical protein
MKTLIGLLALGLTTACVTDGKDGMEGPAGPAGENGSNGADGTPGGTGPQGPAGPELAPPAVYTLTNASAGNDVAAYTRASNGNLTRKGEYTTGGNGAGAGLGSQGALVYDSAMQRFFAVNAGDNTVSMLAIDRMAC